MNRFLGGVLLDTAVHQPNHLTNNSSGKSNVEFQFFPKILAFFLRFNSFFHLSILRHFFSNSTSTLATKYLENYQSAVIIIMHNIDLLWRKPFPFFLDFDSDFKSLLLAENQVFIFR